MYAVPKKSLTMRTQSDVVVEAEIGHVGVGHNVGVSENANADDSRYTTVDDAKAFIEATDVDLLASSLVLHMVYIKERPKSILSV